MGMVYKKWQNLTWGGFLSVSTPTPGCFSRKEDVRHFNTLFQSQRKLTEHNGVNTKTAVVISHLESQGYFINLVFPEVAWVYNGAQGR